MKCYSENTTGLNTWHLITKSGYRKMKNNEMSK